jgi:prepilin-type N-terminal cleavage/methylation domain-containing protein/prepilin-type processing-associated H-X9-DG protein
MNRSQPTNCCAPADRPRSGFTLIELIMVVAIVGGLAALLLPAIAKAKPQARRLQCMNLQKQWTMAFRMYVDDNDGWIPREGYRRFGLVLQDNWMTVRGSTINGTNDSEDVWYNALPDYLSVPRASAYAHASKRPEFYERRSFFHCPAARFPDRIYNYNYSMALFSMAMNSQLIEYPRVPSIRFNLLKDEESRTVLFLDNLLDGEPALPGQENFSLGQPAAYADRFSARHSKGGNLAFADGHVAWFPAHKVVNTDPTRSFLGGPILPPVDIVWDPQPER